MTVVTVVTVLYFWECRHTRTMQNYVKKYQIGSSLAMNFEKTPTIVSLISSCFLAKKNSK